MIKKYKLLPVTQEKLVIFGNFPHAYTIPKGSFIMINEKEVIFPEENIAAFGRLIYTEGNELKIDGISFPKIAFPSNTLSVEFDLMAKRSKEECLNEIKTLKEFINSNKESSSKLRENQMKEKECFTSSTSDTEKSTGALRYNNGKTMLSLLPPIALKEIAEVLTFGAKKYNSWNWAKGLKSMETVDSLMRHLNSWIKGEDIDPESGLSHLAHIGCNAMFLIDNSTLHPELDTRPSVYKEQIERAKELEKSFFKGEEIQQRIEELFKDTPKNTCNEEPVKSLDFTSGSYYYNTYSKRTFQNINGRLVSEDGKILIPIDKNPSIQWLAYWRLATEEQIKQYKVLESNSQQAYTPDIKVNKEELQVYPYLVGDWVVIQGETTCTQIIDIDYDNGIFDCTLPGVPGAMSFLISTINRKMEGNDITALYISLQQRQ